MFPAADRVLDAGQARRTRFDLFLVPDQPLHYGPVPAHLAEQVIKQSGLPQRACEQLLGRVRLSAQLAHERFHFERQLALRLERRALLFRLIRFDQIHPTVGTLHQVMINVRAAIATFDFVIFGWGSDASGHEEIVSRKRRDDKIPL